MSHYPFKFLDSYTKENRAFFFGRDEEIKTLYEMVFQTNMVFVYGPSGAGKTSLIQCGLASKFEDTDWFEMYVRKGDDICASTLQAIQKHTVVSEEEDDFWEDEEDFQFQNTAAETVQYTVSQQALVNLYNSNLKPIYIIYDQFEELYTLGNTEEQTSFITLVKELEAVNIPCTFLFVMREEYLASLYDFEKFVPNLLKKKLRVEHMNLKKVHRVIRGITKSTQSIITLTGDKATKTKIVDNIFDKVREGKRTLLLPYLQIFMDRMYEKVTGDTAKKRNIPVSFSLSDVESMQNIDILLESFLEAQIDSIESELRKANHTIPDEFVMSILSPLVTLDGTKEPIKKDNLLTKGELAKFDTTLISQTLNLLENSRILRYRPEEEMYEIAHDTLAKEIGDKRSEDEKAFLKAKRLVNTRYANYADTNTFLNSAELAFVEPYKDKLYQELGGKEQYFIRKSKQRKRIRLFAFMGSVIGLLAMAAVLVFYVNNKRIVADKAVEKMNIQTKKTEKTLEALTVQQAETKAALEAVTKEKAISEAKELMVFGNSYNDLGKTRYACESYKKGLALLEGYETENIYKELNRKLKRCN